jgi:hypothetical protein
MKSRVCLQTTLSDSDPPKSPDFVPLRYRMISGLKRGTLTEFSPLFKRGGGDIRGKQTRPSTLQQSRLLVDRHPRI